MCLLWLIPQERALWMNPSCFHQGVLKTVIYEHLHVDGLRLFTLVKRRFMLMDDSDELKKTQDLLINTQRSGSSDRQSRTSEWSFKWALCRGRSERPPGNTTGREEKKNCWAHSMLEQERPNGSLRYESESKSKSLHTAENIRRVPTQVTWLLFPELLPIMSLPVFSPHLWSSPFFFFLFFPSDKQRLLWSWWNTNEKKKKINGFILEEDKKLLALIISPL